MTLDVSERAWRIEHRKWGVFKADLYLICSEGRTVEYKQGRPTVSKLATFYYNMTNNITMILYHLAPFFLPPLLLLLLPSNPPKKPLPSSLLSSLLILVGMYCFNYSVSFYKSRAAVICAISSTNFSL